MSRRPPLSREPQTAVVDGFTHGGDGVVRLEGKAVFVPRVLPGETVTVRVVEDRKNWAKAELVEVVDPAPGRVEPPCPYVPECGGCDLQHAAPDRQRALKTRVVREQLERLGKITDPPVRECVSVGPDTGYRNHAQLHAGGDGRLGFRTAGTHEVVPVDTCLVLTPATQAVRDGVGDDTGADEVVVRAHGWQGSSAAVLHPGPGPLHIPDGDFDLALSQPDGSLARLRGDAVLTEQVSGLTFQFDATSFFQVNTGGAEAIVEAVLDTLGDVAGQLVWDLYAGVGLLSLPLRRAGADVIAVEGDAAAADWLVTNAEDNGLPVDVRHGDVRDFVRDLAGGGPAREATADAAEADTGVAEPETYLLDPEAPDAVVLDPPRSGAGPDTVAAIAAQRPGIIVYVACDPASLARDAKALAAEGYRLTDVLPLDLFPMTHHVECVATFSA